MTSVDAEADGQHLPLERRACWVQGIVQGVGFRPFVHRVAVGLGLSGFVRNQSGLVYLEVEGDREVLNEFARQLAKHPPSLSQVESIRWTTLIPQGTNGFFITESHSNDAPDVFISPDVSTCDECLAELFNPSDRRYLYPFINCMNCGPRLTIIREAPYDRQRTTMSAFAMCAACQKEYEDPADRRFHAQPIACPECGPQLRLLTNAGLVIATQDSLGEFIEAIRSGKIGALKGLGGYHLVCDASAPDVVAELRARKHRDAKPFAVMIGDLEQARRLCEIDEVEASLLSSSRRPIVLLRLRQEMQKLGVAANIAPGNTFLGVMLPYTPLHYLLMEAMDGRPLVMTSGNRSDEPMAHDDQDAVERLGKIVDLILTHNRPIHVRCDDSVTRSIDGHEAVVRRSRGYAPQPLSLPTALAQPSLAVGGQLKATFGLGRERLAFLSHHLGDLDHFSAYQAFERDLQLYENLFDAKPKLIIHDLHPDYASSIYAVRRAKTEGLKRLAVQHHHAHVASGMAEHGLDRSVIGVAFDGTGYGADGAIWGGEFLIANYSKFHRAAHLRYVGLPGGDTAIREPWRAAVSHLMDAGCDPSRFESVSTAAIRTVEKMLKQNFNSPNTSSMGRLFDAVAAIAGVRTHASYEGQAAVELEFLATQVDHQAAYPFAISVSSFPIDEPFYEIDTRPMIRAIVDDVAAGRDKALIARRFHSTVVEIVARVCCELRGRWNLEHVVLTGGVFMNRLLSNEVARQLSGHGFTTYRHQIVPCNDGGLSFGQLAVAAGLQY